MEHYLDNSSTTKPCKEAVEAALDAMTHTFGNPSSLHALGFAASRALEDARESVAAVLGVSRAEITFTSGGTEANNLAIFGAYEARKKRGRRVVTTAIEHPSVLNPMKALEKRGAEVVYVKPDGDGRISPEVLAQAVTPDTVLVSLMAVNNEVGTVLPIDAAHAAIVRTKAPALLHVDAVQAFGKLPLKPSRRGIDLLTVSAHKIHGLKGTGALYIRKGVHILPHTFGGGQERDVRPGTEGMPGILAFGAACRALPDPQKEAKAIEALNARVRAGLQVLPDVTVLSPADASPYVLSFSAGRVRAQTMLNFLSARGVYVSSGSACAKGAESHVLKAMGLSKDQIDSALRVSFSRDNTEEDCDALLSALAEGMRTLQAAR